MKYLKPYNLFENFNKNLTLYHGSKSCSKFTEFDFTKFPYMYLTDNINYAIFYAYGREKCITTFKIDTSKFVDLRSLGCKYEVDFKKLQQQFYKLTKVYLPAECKKYHDYNWNKYIFWNMVRQDIGGLIKNRMLVKGYNGFIMEEYAILAEHPTNIHTAYVLLNNDPIIS